MELTLAVWHRLNVLRSIFPVGFCTARCGIARPKALTDDVSQGETDDDANEEFHIVPIDNVTANGSLTCFSRQGKRWIVHALDGNQSRHVLALWFVVIVAILMNLDYEDVR